MYRALYRKWRPQRFEDVVGQTAITDALKNQLLNEKVGHAYLFTGTRGTGKTTCAKLFAKAVNCEAPENAEPCGKCVPCKGMEDGSILDVVEIDAASNNGVDDVRELREETAYRPARGRYRVYIIDEVHMLSTAAFNALLKILEEPPSHVIFILATTESHKVPATILSRCQRFDFMRIPAEDIAGRVLYVAEQEDIEISDEAADLIARLADGAMRDALSLLDTCAGMGQAVDVELVRRLAGVADKRYLFDISTAVAQRDTGALLKLVAQLRGQSVDVRRLCEELVHHYRNFMLVHADPSGALLEAVPTEDRQRYIDEANRIPEIFSIKALRRLAAAMDRMGRSPDPRVELELALFDLSEGGDEPAAIRPAVKPGAQPAYKPAAAPVPAQPEPPPAVPKTPASWNKAQADEAPFDVPEPPGVPEPEEAKAEEPPMTDGHKAVAVAEAPPEEKEPVGTLAAPPMPVLEEGIVPFEQWPQVLSTMAGIDRMLYSYMKGSNAFVDGGRVLIQGGDMFLTFMRTNEFASDRIKTVIQQVTGKRYGIGPYKPGEGKAGHAPTAEDTLKKWEEMGVEVQYD